MLRSLVTALLIALSLTAPSSAATTDTETQANLGRAAAYWGASPNCPDGVDVIVDESVVGPGAYAAAAGCDIWTGDNYALESRGQKCQTLTHEWGHLLGYGHVAGLPNDPLGVMVTYTLPPACAALDTQPIAVTAQNASALAAWAAYDDAYVKWSHQKMARFDCRATANGLRRRVSRVKARSRCVKRYGVIGHGPAMPSMPRPSE